MINYECREHVKYSVSLVLLFSSNAKKNQLMDEAILEYR